MASDEFFSYVKNLVKRFPRLYRATVYVFGGQPQNTTAFQFVQQFPQGSKIINVGSGSRRLPGTINIDVMPYTGVDIVADAEKLPFDANTVDAIVCDNVLEHTRRPHKVVEEFVRVLKPGGKVYVAVPFVIPYHSSPGDFYRWSEEGIRELLSVFTEEEVKIQYGPSAAFTMVLSEWLALLLSFNSRILYTAVFFVATIVTAPLKLFDYLLVHYQGAMSMPLDIYFIGSKK
jgi:SAM-dependent methyltransferase